MGLALPSTLSGQLKKYSLKQGPEQQLEEAQRMSGKQPEKAILLVENVVKESKERRDQRLEAQAFLLLGDIYENIDQDRLALQRFYQSANLAQGLKDQALLAQANYKMGQMRTKLGEFAEAQTNFNLCIKVSPNSDLVTKCQEGLADLAFAKKDYTQSEQLYDQVRQDKNILADSVSIARIEAKKSQNYISQKRYNEAEESFQNSLNSLPKRSIEPDEFDPIREANERLMEEDTAAQGPNTSRLNSYRPPGKIGASGRGAGARTTTTSRCQCAGK